MNNPTPSCCGTQTTKSKGVMEVPPQIQRELDAAGGLKALTDRVPEPAELEEESRVYHALADPLRLTILYLIKDQPLCVCVINRFTRLSGPKLSYHLNILKESELAKGEYHGNWIIYSLTDKGRKYLR